jgi:hypothetical protein
VLLLSQPALSLSCVKCPPGNSTTEEANSHAHKHIEVVAPRYAPLRTAGISRLRFLLWLQDDFFTRSFPHVPRQNYYDKVRPNAFWGSWVRL